MNNNSIFNRIFNLVSLIAVAMMTVPLALMLLNGTFPYSSVILPAVAILSTVCGYVMQNVFSKGTHKKASTDGFGSFDEGIVAGFSMKYAGIPITISLILAVAAGSLAAFERKSRR